MASNPVNYRIYEKKVFGIKLYLTFVGINKTFFPEVCLISVCRIVTFQTVSVLHWCSHLKQQQQLLLGMFI